MRIPESHASSAYMKKNPSTCLVAHTLVGSNKEAISLISQVAVACTKLTQTATQYPQIPRLGCVTVNTRSQPTTQLFAPIGREWMQSLSTACMAENVTIGAPVHTLVDAYVALNHKSSSSSYSVRSIVSEARHGWIITRQKFRYMKKEGFACRNCWLADRAPISSRVGQWGNAFDAFPFDLSPLDEHGDMMGRIPVIHVRKKKDGCLITPVLYQPDQRFERRWSKINSGLLRKGQSATIMQ